MIQLGQYNLLKATRETKSGLYLADEEGKEVLLPGKYIPQNVKIGDKLEVFIYKDSEDRLIATTQTPKITLHQFAYLPVKAVNAYAAFVDWGLEKDLFVPYKEQPQKLIAGNSYVFYLYVDEQTDRLVASANVDRFLNNETLTIQSGEEVEIIIWQATDLGYNVIINNVHKGLIYKNELFAPVQIGETRKAYIKKIREGNRIDVQLQKSGYENVEPNAAKILQKLAENHGFLALHDNSAPEDISRELEMSKKTFKKAIGLLYKQQAIRLTEDGIYLNEAE
ncbi:MAG: S1 RNA-binding domain-containing protein [Saprospiraceae bacterium]